MQTRFATESETPDFFCPNCETGFVDESKHNPVDIYTEVNRRFTCETCMKPFEVNVSFAPHYRTCSLSSKDHQ